MVSIKQEPSCWDDTKMISIKQDISAWDDSHNVDIDWEQDFGLQLMDLPTSEFLTSAAELEQTYGGANCAANGWDQPANSKTQIRNHDCMWSGTCFDQSHPSKMGCGNNHTHTTQDQPEVTNKFSTVTAVAAASLNNNVAVTQKPILTPANTSALNINNNLTAKFATIKPQTAQIPAGRSLLINPRIKQQQQMNRIPTVSTSDFLRERETSVPLHRPDTPLSLDEDPPEFKHNIDLATCTIGSNRMSLTGNSRHYKNHQNHHDDPSSHRIINMLKEQLEDTESGSLRMTSSSGEIGSLTDLLNDLEEMEEMESGDGDDSHGEDLDSDTDSNAGDSSSRSSSSKGGGISGGYTHAHHQEMSPSSSSSSSSSSYEYQGTHVGDHSYTRPKDRYHLTGLGVQTPSDSEEEIDVVSIGEKNLPTNPTPRDKRHVESRVALKIRKHPQAVNSSHHHRRRHSDDEYAAAAHHGPSSTGSSQPSPSKSSYGYSPNYLTPASSTSISGSNTPLPGSNGSSSISSNPRKRPSSKDDRNSSKNRHHQHRNKKQRIPGKTIAKAPEPVCEEQETLEKRNLHNDMERQRRIGLKNLFEELKRQIPNLRDKERAPKVNILREASILCTRLNREQEQLNALRKQQQRLYARVRQLRTSLHSQRRTMD